MDGPLYNVQRAYVQRFNSTFINGDDENRVNTKVRFKLFLARKHEWIELWETVGTRTIHETEFTSVERVFEIDLPLLQDENTAQQRIQLVLASMDYFTPENLYYLKVDIATRANRSISGSNHKILDSCEATVQVVNKHYYDYGAVTRMLNYHGDPGFSLVPASSTSVQALRIKKPEEVDIDQTCSVCLNQFSLGNEEVAEMPCAHIFHRQCIVSWLERKNMCPLCRFQLAHQ